MATITILVANSFPQVFHQADEGGNPVMDLGHIVTSLNKLDAAVEDERIILASRDGKTLMVVSYGDVRTVFGKGLRGKLCNAAAIPPSPHYQY
jgi:PAB-dependent poly(A)-specific ribonuclease subunit 3